MEAVEVHDIEQSPLVPRVCNNLRQTRSEENLSTMIDSDADLCCWSQEDEEISTQVREYTEYYELSVAFKKLINVFLLVFSTFE